MATNDARLPLLLPLSGMGRVLNALLQQPVRRANGKLSL